MNIYEIQTLVERLSSQKNYIPTSIPEDHIIQDINQLLVEGVDFFPFHEPLPSPSAFKPGHDNSNAVAAARKATRGSKQSKIHKQRRAAAQRKKVCVDGVIYNSITEAAESLGVGKPAISNRIKRGRTAWLM